MKSTLDQRRILAETSVLSVECFAVLDSTNVEAKRKSDHDGRRLPCLIAADRQTAGRGRGTHRWWTGDGALAVSLLFDPIETRLESRQAPLLAAAVGVAVVRAVRSVLPDASLAAAGPLGLHWPNDVFLDDAKIAGILVEWLGPRRCVVGVGVNTNNSAADAPGELRRRRIATLRDVVGRGVEHTDLVIAWVHALDQMLALVSQSPEALIREADSLCLQKGRTIKVLQDGSETIGRCVGLNADGALLLQDASRTRAFYSGSTETLDAE